MGGEILYKDIDSILDYQNKFKFNIFNIPIYIAHSVIRIFIAFFISLILSIFIGISLAKYHKLEIFFIPVIDILQSIPVIGFIACTIEVFTTLFPHSLWGAQFIAIFALVTAQIWNMIFSVYQSIKIFSSKFYPKIKNLSFCHKLWHLYIPIIMPGLIWNAMLSLSASWGIIVAVESIMLFITEKEQIVLNLIGIGSFINYANEHQDFTSILYSILAIFFTITLYNFIIFNFLFKKYLDNKTITIQTHIMKKNLVYNYSIKTQSFFIKNIKLIFNKKNVYVFCFFIIIYFVFNHNINFTLILNLINIIFLTLITGLRVLCVVIISSIIWVPIGLWIGKNDKIINNIQLFIQMLAALPVNIMYGIFIIIMFWLNLNFNFSCILLMMFSSQWYILFNVIGGTTTISKKLKKSFNNNSFKYKIKHWKKFYKPIIPFYITGASTAAGNAWNVSILCEYVNWGESSIIKAVGIGSYISSNYYQSNFINVYLSIIVIGLTIFIINRMFWNKLYNFILQ